MSRKARRWLIMGLLLVVLVLEVLPIGVVMRFALPDGETPPHLYAYFDILPYGYGRFAPFLTAWASLLLSVLCLIYTFKDAPALRTVCLVFALVTASLSLSPAVFGLLIFKDFSAVSIVISLLLWAAAILLITLKRKE